MSDVVGSFGAGGTAALGWNSFGFGLSGGFSFGFSQSGKFIMQVQLYSMDKVKGFFFGAGPQVGGTYSVCDVKKGPDSSYLQMKSGGVALVGGGELQVATDEKSIGIGGGGGRVDGGIGVYYAEGTMFSAQYAFDLKRFFK